MSYDIITGSRGSMSGMAKAGRKKFKGRKTMKSIRAAKKRRKLKK